MRLLSLYQHGSTMGTPPSKTNKTPSKRGKTNGWNAATSRRNTNFLRSVDDLAIVATSDGEPLTGLACTFTLKTCPPSPDDWESIRRAFLDRLRRIGLYRSHWLTEWQKRGVPHLHACFFFPEATGLAYVRLCESIQYHWLALTSDYGAKPVAQHITPVYDAVGWFQYQCKHASRGMHHYQRSPENIPKNWEKTPRMWGYTGQWELIEPERVLLHDKTYFTLRRLLRNWRIADARKTHNQKRISKARKMLKHNDKELSKLRGISEWINIEQSKTLLNLALKMHDLENNK